MSKLIVEGKKRLEGEIEIQGAKNSVLPILAATLLIEGVSVIHNCPDLSDVEVAIKILSFLGCKCKREEGTVTVDASVVNCDRIPDELMREMRSSVMFLGAILARCGSAVISSPGGCELGPRPIDLHLKALSDLGYCIEEKGGYIFCRESDGTAKDRVNLSFPSVGATENAILAAVCKHKNVIITGVAKEPEICDLVDFLNKSGAKISGAGTDVIEIIGVKKLCSSEHTVIPDRIVAATYMSAAAVTGGNITLKNIEHSHLGMITDKFIDMGCEVRRYGNHINITSNGNLEAIRLTKSLVYPGFPTDAGPLLVSALTVASGCSVFVETIFENRFRYIDELIRLGADIRLQNRVAVIQGVKRLKGAKVSCTDLRGGAALVICGLAADGVTEIDKIYHIERGYENFSDNFKVLGANITKED